MKVIITLLLLFSYCPAQAQWEKTLFPVSSIGTSAHQITGKYFYVSTDGFSFFYRSSDHGYTWENLASFLPKEKAILGLISSGDTLIASLTDWNPDSTGGIYYSIDNAHSWINANGNGQNVGYLSKLYWIGNYLYGEYNGQLIRSVDRGNNWKAATNGIVAGLYITKLLLLDTSFFASTYGEGIYISSDTGRSWKQQNNIFLKDVVYDIANIGKTLFATNGSLYKSTNNGESWSNILSNVNSIHVHNGYIFACGDSVFLSNDTGKTWLNITGNLPGSTIFIDSDSEYVYAGFWWRRPIADFYSSIVTSTIATPNTLSIFPNPVIDGNCKLDLSSIAPQDLEISLYDLLGRKVYSEFITTPFFRASKPINTNGLSNGTYILEVKGKGIVQRLKLSVME